MFKKMIFYTKMGYKLFKGDVIGRDDYKAEYNKASGTYINWINEMGIYTDKIIKPEYVFKKDKLKILDFACGTGYITNKLLKQNLSCEITAVDFSGEMLNHLKNVDDNRLKIIHSEGINFLETTEEKYDVIFFGWALSYFDYKELFNLFRKVLNPGGIIGIITNTNGTLSGIEDIFLKVMYRNSKDVIKPMDIKFNLPNGKEGLIKWFNKYDFENIEIYEEEVLCRFEEPDQLLNWLNETGATAGTGRIFKDYDIIKTDLVEEIRKLKYKHGQYEINHRFTYGIFRLK